MIDISIDITTRLETAVATLCKCAGSHIAITLADGLLSFSSVASEYFKIYAIEVGVDCHDFGIRIPKKIVKPVITAGDRLRLVVDSDVTIYNYRDSELRIAVSMPLEIDFNSGLVSRVINSGTQATTEYDLSGISGLRPVVNYALNGLQFKGGLAYIHGTGFIVYKTMKHPVDFVMTKENITEMVAFVQCHRFVAVYTCDQYVVFKSGTDYFGCRLPVRFIDSEYDAYQQAEPLAETTVSLGSLFSVLQGLTLPKNEYTQCRFDLSKNTAIISLGMLYRYNVEIPGAAVGDVSFNLPLKVVKDLLSNSRLSYTAVRIRVYDSFVAFIFEDTHILICKE